MASWIDALTPKFGRPVRPGEETAARATHELQIHQIAVTSPILAASALVLGGGVAALFWNSVPAIVLGVWIAAMAAATAAMLLLLRGIKERIIDEGDSQLVLTWIVRLSVARALVWGVGAAVFYHYATPTQLAILAVVVVGNALGAGAALISVWRAAIGFAICSVTPLAAVLFASGAWEQAILGVLLLVYAGGLRSAAGQLFKFVADEAQLRRALIAHQRELAQAKIEAEAANRTKSEFLAHMSHELRTPLNAVIGFSEAMMNTLFGPLNARYADYARDINESGQHLLRMINDILDLSKIEAGVLTVENGDVDLHDAFALVDRLLRERAHKKGVKLEIRAVADDLRIHSDERLVKQILINLATNAIKFTPAGGRVVLAAERRDAANVMLSVRDTGVGMSAEDIAIALTPFGQVGDGTVTRREGTGLGLPLCDRFARALGGELLIESARGAGTRVGLILPAPETAPARFSADALRA